MNDIVGDMHVSDISIFVADCVLFCPDHALKEKGNLNLNRDNTVGELKASMTKAFLDLTHRRLNPVWA
ncbi:hypothetical protein [Chitinophaga agri]|uniref:Uncharacterized protein n=1 Tax=Chitinophaga agri TaxID=2703787 RepID=A0A6B9ZAH7_9BACT|nr:hypothetical protein [Chitinophaga agri]QHS58491.1 hypothetical protein GWR21_02435 [Chitinophaga agri]